MKGVRAYCFTINNYDDEDYCVLTILYSEGIVRYYCIGFEVGEQGTPHVQGYLYLKDAMTKSALSRHLPRAYITAANCKDERAWDYCKKDGNFIEEGEPPHQGRITMEYVQEIMDDPTLNFSLYSQYRRTYDEYKRNYKAVPTERFLYFVEDSQLEEFLGADPYCFFDDYVDEDTVVMRDVFSHADMCFVRDWYKGRPVTTKRGYERFPFRASRIVILYTCLNTLATYRDTFEFGVEI